MKLRLKIDWRAMSRVPFRIAALNGHGDHLKRRLDLMSCPGNFLDSLPSLPSRKFAVNPNIEHLIVNRLSTHKNSAKQAYERIGFELSAFMAALEKDYEVGLLFPGDIVIRLEGIRYQSPNRLVFEGKGESGNLISIHQDAAGLSYTFLSLRKLGTTKGRIGFDV